MKINIAQKLYKKDGTPLQLVEEDGTKTDYLLKEALIKSALTETDNDTKQKTSDFSIFLKLQQAKKEVTLENKEVTRLQKKSEVVHGVLVFGQINEILEGRENPIKEKEKDES